MAECKINKRLRILTRTSRGLEPLRSFLILFFCHHILNNALRHWSSGFRSIILATLLIFIPNFTIADDKKEIIISGLSFPPYIIASETGPPSGIIVDLVTKALTSLNYSVKFEITNWARAYNSVKIGAVDGIIPTIKSKDRETFLSFPVKPLLNLEMILLTAKGSEVDYDGSIASLRPYQLGKVRKARVSPAFDKAIEQGKINVDERTDFNLLVSAAAYKRLDAVAMDRLLAIWIAKKKGVENLLKTLEPPLASAPVYLAMNKKRFSPAEMQELNQIFQQFEKDGTREKIIEKYIEAKN